MALSTAELTRLRYELGYNVLGVAAEPYVEYHAVFDRVVATYLQAGASTTSTTAVTAVADGADPAPATLTLASATGFVAGDRVVVDVDDRQETATVQSVSGLTITLLLSGAHSGTYPVTVEGGETIVREALARCRNVAAKVESAAKVAGLKRAEDIEWYQAGSGTGAGTVMNDLKVQRMYWRDELASALGVTNLWRLRHGQGLSLSVY